jgi:hypothetical protein
MRLISATGAAFVGMYHNLTVGSDHRSLKKDSQKEYAPPDDKAPRLVGVGAVVVNEDGRPRRTRKASSVENGGCDTFNFVVDRRMGRRDASAYQGIVVDLIPKTVRVPNHQDILNGIQFFELGLCRNQ